MMSEAMFEAAKHDGTSVIEVLQNCVIYNDNIHEQITGKEFKDENQLYLRNGYPMLFGKNMEKGLRLKGTRLEVVKIGENGITENDILVHDQYDKDPGIHLMLAKLEPPLFPIALGVIRSAMYPTFDDMVEEQITTAKKTSAIKCVDDLLNSGDTWEIS